MVTWSTLLTVHLFSKKEYQLMLSKEWTKSTRSSSNVVLAALALIGVIAVYNWIVAPHKNYLLAAQRYELATGNLAEKNQSIRSDVTGKKRELEKLQEQFKEIHTGLFDPIKARKFFSSIQVVSEETNCTVYLLEFSPNSSASNADKSEAISYVTVQRAILSVGGSYRNIAALMDKLQDRLERVRIDSISIKPIGNSSAQLKCNMTITIYVIQGEEGYAHD